MTSKAPDPLAFRAPTRADIWACLRTGWSDFAANVATDAVFASVFVAAGLLMGWITLATGQTFWLVLAALGFPLIGALAAVAFYEISRRAPDASRDVANILSVVWSQRHGQLPWLAVVIVVIFLAWFFLGHMIFALFLGLSPMTNVTTSAEVFFTPQGLGMLAFGSAVGAAFATLVFAISVLGMPLILARDVDFVTAMLKSAGAVRSAWPVYLLWGATIGLLTLLAMIPAFLGLFIAMPVLGHASWHLYQRLSV